MELSHNGLLKELFDLFGEDVFVESQLMTMDEMFSYTGEIDPYVNRLKEVAKVNGDGNEYKNIVNNLSPELSAALCKYIADGWASYTKH